MPTTIKKLPQEVIIDRLKFENTWWSDGFVPKYYTKMYHRMYFDLFVQTVTKKTLDKPLVMLGQRGIGKTSMVFQTIQKLIDLGIPVNKIAYVSMELPTFRRNTLETIFELIRKAIKDDSKDDFFIFFHEIQYAPDWENQLKTLAEAYPNTRFIGISSIAILKKNGRETHCCRFESFRVPMLSFYEFLELKNSQKNIEFDEDSFNKDEVAVFNQHFLDYINYGSYPDIILAKQKINHTIIGKNGINLLNKTLLRDIPNFYGINRISQMNRFFTLLAYYSGTETTLDELSQTTEISPKTITKYIDYLEDVFLIKKIMPIGLDGKAINNGRFKIYLTDSSMRTALFQPITADSPFLVNLAITTMLAQWQHVERDMIAYAKWDNNELNIVKLAENKTPIWITDIHSGDKPHEDSNTISKITEFCTKHNIPSSMTTTLDHRDIVLSESMIHSFEPTSLYCYSVGRQIVEDNYNTSQSF